MKKQINKSHKNVDKATLLVNVINEVVSNPQKYLKPAEKTFYKGYSIVKKSNKLFDVMYNNYPVYEDVLFIDIAKYLIDYSSHEYKCYQIRSFENRFISAKDSNQYYSILSKKFKDNVYYKAMVTETYHVMLESLDNISQMLGKTITYI